MTLAVAGLFAALGPNLAQACHIRHESNTAAAHDKSLAASKVAEFDSSIKNSFTQAAQNFMKDWHQLTTPTPPTITPTVAHTSTPVAAQMLAPSTSTPTVANQNTMQPAGCPPPPPPCPSMTTTAPKSPTITPPAPQVLQTPSGLMTTSPTPTPEPSTILSAIAMVGVVAWRRRSTQLRS